MSAPSSMSGREPVYLITHEFSPWRGGIATFAEEIARAAVSLGHDLEVWAQSAEAGDGPGDWPFRLRRLPLRGTHDLACQVSMARQLIRRRRELREATVYLPEPGPMLAMMPLQFFRSFRPRRLILTFHGSEILKFADNPLRRWLAGQLIRRADRVSTLSEYSRGLLLKHFPEAADRVCLTPGALRAGFVETPAGGRTSRDDDRLVVLTVGRLHPRKGQLQTLRALQLLRPEVRSRVEYWVAGGQGKGGYEEELRVEAARCPDLRVRFLGVLSDAELGRVYAEADIFAMTSLSLSRSVEGFGLVYLEAAAHGLPVVAHDVGGVAEAVSDGVTGLLVPPDQPARLADAFEKLALDADLRRRMGDAGRAWARRNSWRQSAEILFNFKDT